ncbi:hypothetical protein FSP39_012204 [Pinctada imbricata]|uniref:Uncharacterized protein n=1 Tax=Pinctada imbricata TaxID=66713 RepID=A0AA88YV32_PINIB|nr:hypothetical protein FSP39_012204 [Pinctada imbricata]
MTTCCSTTQPFPSPKQDRRRTGSRQTKRETSNEDTEFPIQVSSYAFRSRLPRISQVQAENIQRRKLPVNMSHLWSYGTPFLLKLLFSGNLPKPFYDEICRQTRPQKLGPMPELERSKPENYSILQGPEKETGIGCELIGELTRVSGSLKMSIEYGNWEEEWKKGLWMPDYVKRIVQFCVGTIPISMGNGKSKHHLFIANNTGVHLRALISPNKKWRLQQLFAESPDDIISGMPNGIETIEDLQKVWMKASTSKDSDYRNSIYMKIQRLFDRYGILIKNEMARNVYDTALFNPLEYLTSAGWFTLCACQDFCVTLLIDDSKDTLKMAQFDTMEDWSWIANKSYVTKAKDDTLWKETIDSGYRYVSIKFEVKKVEKKYS